MKLVMMIMLMTVAMGAQAGGLKDLLPILIGGGNSPSHPMPPPSGYPGRPGHGPGYGPGYGGPGHGGQPYYPGYGVTCRAGDRGFEEHWGGHASCGECLQKHGECIETCSTTNTECRVEGRDRNGVVLTFVGRGRDRWAAESDGIRACQYNYATNCYVVSCNDRQEILSRRSCR